MLPTLRSQFSFKLFTVLAVALGIGIAAAFFFYNLHHIKAPTKQSMPYLPSPTPTPSAAQPAEKSWPSPDGHNILIMHTQLSSNHTVTYVFAVKTPDQTTEQVIFRKTVPSTVTMTIPFNSWSPDDKHFFIQEHDGDRIRTLVFNASGAAFKDGQIFEDITDFFSKKNSKYTLGEVTGWASPIYVVVNARAADGSLASSFWFDISRQTFIPLATKFE